MHRVSFTACVALLLACGPAVEDADDRGPGSTGESSELTPESCRLRCLDKAQECGAPPGNEISEDECQDICAALDPDRLVCVETTECPELTAQWEAGEAVCAAD